MKVGVYLGHLDPTAGGAFTYAETIINGIRRAGGSHEFVFFSYGGEAGDDGRQVRLQAARPRRPLRARLAGAPRRLDAPGVLNAAAVDRGIELMWFPTLAWEHVDAPFICTVWDLQHRLQSFFPEVSVSGFTFAEREAQFGHILPRAAVVVVPNPALARELQLFYGLPAERIAALPQPTPDFALAAAVDPARLPERSLARDHLFYPAQFWPHKNHVVLLHALKLLRERHGLAPRLVLTGADKGNLAHVQATAAALGVDGQVAYEGFVTQERLVQLYREAFALVFPSFFGPENMPPLEAFGLGCPVVAAQVSGAEHQLGDAALLFDPRSEEQLVAQLLHLEQDHGTRQVLVGRGLERARACTGREFAAGLLRVIDRFAPIRRCWSADTPYVHT